MRPLSGVMTALLRSSAESNGPMQGRLENTRIFP